MKILHMCLACFYIDNHSYQENMLPKYHKKMGHEVTILASMLSFNSSGEPCYLNNESEYLNSDGIKVIRKDYRAPIKSINRVLRSYNETYKIIEQEKPQVIFVHGSQFVDIKCIIKYVKKYKDVKVFIDNHADFSNSATNWISKNILHKVIWKYFAKKMIPYTTKFYGVLPSRVDFLVNMYRLPKEKVELLVMGADDEKVDLSSRKVIRSEIREKYNINENDFLIITGGKIDSAKWQTLLLMEAVKEMNKKEIKLIVFGSVTDDLKKDISQYANENNVKYIGWIGSEDVYDYFAASDLAVFPGRHSVLWEQAVGTGIPCIFKFWEGTTHVDVGGNCKFLYNDDKEEIKKKLNEIIDNKDIYNEMKKVSLERGISTFSYRDIAERSILIH